MQLPTSLARPSWLMAAGLLFSSFIFTLNLADQAMIFQIAIIGAGQIGSRHLQALNLIDRDIAISVFDPSSRSLRLAKKRFEELHVNKFVRLVSYSETFDSLNHDIDVAIIATSADVRRQVIEQLLQKVRVRFFILEKVAFQSVTDFENIMELLEEKKSKAWVNCSYRRMYPFYQEMLKCFHVGEQIFFNIWGGGWGLACNSIHMLDLFSYFTGQTSISLDGSRLDKSIQKSKRKGFIELTGILRGVTDNGSEISLLDYQGTVAPFVIQVFSRDSNFIIFESEGKAIKALKTKNWIWNEIPFSILYQSQLTHLAVQQILDTGDCVLASIEESFCLHKPMLKTFIDHLGNVTGKKHNKCPIT